MFLNNVTYFSIASIFAGLVFIAVGIWAFCRKTPMHFWSGTTVSPETITDVKKYNKANGFMWVIASLIFFVAPIIAYKDFNLAITFFSIAIPSLLVILFISYNLILKYFSVVKM